MKIDLYTDGSSTGKVGEGGWGFVVLEDDRIVKESSGGADETTNNRMELQGVIEGLIFIKNKYPSNVFIRVYSDSQYVVKGINLWYPKWKEKIDRGKVIKNQDLWIDLKGIVDLFDNIELLWVRGHDGNVYNEKCDYLAKQAKLLVKEQRG